MYLSINDARNPQSKIRFHIAAFVLAETSKGFDICNMVTLRKYNDFLIAY